MATTVYTDWSTTYNGLYYRGWLTYNVSSTNTTTTVTASSGIQQHSAMSVAYTDTQSMTGYSNKTGTTSFSYSTGDTNHTCISTQTYTYTRGTSAATKTLKIAVHATNAASGSGWNTTTLSKSVTITVPAKPSYAVSYNNNGGSGSIASQTKWYGENLTLSGGSGFTREHHTLVGWNTAADGTGTHYNLGQTYTGNAALTLYAEWELNAVKVETKVGGVWKTGILYVKVNGAWVIPHTGYVKVNGAWKQITKE